VSGVVDWATAALGPAGIDLARMRLNVAWVHGVRVANRFASAYVAAGGDPSARNPYWDLVDAADYMAELEPPVGPTLVAFSRFEEYVDSILGEVR
jgi:hypothetical protein